MINVETFSEIHIVKLDLKRKNTELDLMFNMQTIRAKYLWGKLRISLVVV